MQAVLTREGFDEETAQALEEAKLSGQQMKQVIGHEHIMSLCMHAATLIHSDASPREVTWDPPISKSQMQGLCSRE